MAQPIFGNSFAPSVLGSQAKPPTPSVTPASPPPATPASSASPSTGGFTPLTQQQYQSAITAGFTPQQIIANEKIRQQKSQPAPAAATSPSLGLKLKSALTGQGNAPIVSSVPNEIAGIAKETAQTIMGTAEIGSQALGQTLGRGIDWLTGKPGAIVSNPTVKANVNAAIASKGGWQEVGNIEGKAGELLLPTPEISEAKDVMGGIDVADTVAKIPGIGDTLAEWVDTVKDTPYLGKALSYITDKAAKAIPEALFGTTWGLTQGQSPQQAAKTGETFGLLSGAGEAIGDGWRWLKGGIMDNIQKAIPTLNKLTPEQAATKGPQAYSAFKTMSDLADGIKVKTADGIEKAWEPTKDGFFEGLQGFNQVKNKVYQAYSDIATRAGDAGALFTDNDFAKVEEDLAKTQKNATSGFVGKSKSLIADLQRNYGVFDSEGEFEYYKDTPLKDIQDFIQHINTDVNPGSDSAGAKVSDTASKSLRGVMDDKIENTTGEQYQKVRNDYSNLKSIEDGLVSSAKKSFNKVGGRVGQWVEGFGTIDTIVGALTNAPGEALKGGLMVGLSELMKYLKDPTIGMQNAFDMIEGEPAGPLESRLIGTGETPPAVKPSTTTPPPTTTEPPTVKKPTVK
jgi:hypothetical protein